MASENSSSRRDKKTQKFDNKLKTMTELEEELNLRCHLLENALRESLKLQTHYAMLLNSWDQGQRMSFNTIQEWLDRLEEK